MLGGTLRIWRPIKSDIKEYEKHEVCCHCIYFPIGSIDNSLQLLHLILKKSGTRRELLPVCQLVPPFCSAQLNDWSPTVRGPLETPTCRCSPVDLRRHPFRVVSFDRGLTGFSLWTSGHIGYVTAELSVSGRCYVPKRKCCASN